MNALARLDAPRVAVMSLNAELVREAARHQWPSILASLGIDIMPRKHRPCPYCGGKDRFRFDDRDGSGSWFCNACDPHAGDGFAMVMKVQGCKFPEALSLVADILGLVASRPPDARALQEARTTRARARRERERQREAEGLRIDRLREADYLVRVASNVDISRWPDDQLDSALHTLADAYGLLEQEEACHG